MGTTAIAVIASLFPPVTLNAGPANMNAHSTAHSSTFIDATAEFIPIKKLDVSYKIEGTMEPLVNAPGAVSNTPAYYARVEIKAGEYSDAVIVSCDVQTSEKNTEKQNYAPRTSSIPCEGQAGNLQSQLITANSTYSRNVLIKKNTPAKEQAVVLNFSYL